MTLREYYLKYCDETFHHNKYYSDIKQYYTQKEDLTDIYYLKEVQDIINYTKDTYLPENCEDVYLLDYIILTFFLHKNNFYLRDFPKEFESPTSPSAITNKIYSYYSQVGQKQGYTQNDILVDQVNDVLTNFQILKKEN